MNRFKCGCDILRIYCKIQIAVPTESIIVSTVYKVIKSAPVTSFLGSMATLSAVFPVTDFNQILPSPSDLGATVFMAELERGASN